MKLQNSKDKYIDKKNTVMVVWKSFLILVCVKKQKY